MRAQKLKKKEPVNECREEDSKVVSLEALPRDMDTFWRNDHQVPPNRLCGFRILGNNATNKSLAFTHRERQMLSIQGLLPAAHFNLQQQLDACKKHFLKLTSNFQKYVYLKDLESVNRHLFFNLLMSDPQTFLSVFNSSDYAFSVKNFGYLFLAASGLFITIKDRGHIYETLRNYPKRAGVRYIVVTNGESVFSLGDHGVNGSPVVFYKSFQNVVYGGIPPNSCLPIMLDVGTNNETLLRDKFYMGWPHRRVTGPEYEAFFEEFSLAVLRLFGPRTIIQTQCFNSRDSIRQLETYRKRQCFIDITLQCFGACGLAGLLCANRITQIEFKQNIYLFYGDGTFNIGLARLCISYLKRLRLNESAAKERIWFCDSKGLIVHDRCGHKVPEQLAEFMQRHEPIESLIDIIARIKPNVLVGCGSEPNAFTKDVIRAMEQNTQYPIIYAMSSPLSMAECTAEDAFVYTKGRCIFVSSERLPPLKYANRWYQPGHCTSHYVEAGLTLGIALSGMISVPNETFLVAADLLSNLVWPNDLAKRDVFPPIRKLKCVNLQVAECVFTYAYRRRLATLWPEPSNPTTYIASKLFKPEYASPVQQIFCTSDQNVGTTESLEYYKEKI